MGRTPCCDKASVKKGPWSPEEDDKLRGYLDKNGIGGNWIALPRKAGLTRCGKSCRLRWMNYLRPNIKHGEFSDEEDRIICNLFLNIGRRWSTMAAQLPGRTDNDIKNYWNTKLKKSLMTTQKKSFPFAIPSIIQPLSSYLSPLSEKNCERSNCSSLSGGRGGVLTFGIDASSSSSEQISRMSCFSEGFEENKDGGWGETPFKDGFEEMKELISSDYCHSFLFQENQTEEETFFF